MSEEERADLTDAEAVCRRFLSWDMGEADDMGNGQARAKLAEILGRDELF